MKAIVITGVSTVAVKAPDPTMSEIEQMVDRAHKCTIAPTGEAASEECFLALSVVDVPEDYIRIEDLIAAPAELAEILRRFAKQHGIELRT